MRVRLIYCLYMAVYQAYFCDIVFDKMKFRVRSVARMVDHNPEKYTISDYKMKEFNSKIAKNTKK